MYPLGIEGKIHYKLRPAPSSYKKVPSRGCIGSAELRTSLFPPVGGAEFLPIDGNNGLASYPFTDFGGAIGTDSNVGAVEAFVYKK